jgi:hypothetical protein
LKISPANGQSEPASLTNNEPKNFDLRHAYSFIKWIKVRINGKKNKMYFFKAGVSEKLKPHVGLDPSLHVNKTTIHLAAQSLSVDRV